MRRFGHPPDCVWLELMDERLVPEARRAAEAHLVQCNRCTARASAMRRARRACAGLASAPLVQETPPIECERPRWGAALATAAIIVVSTVLWRLDGPRVRFEEGPIGQLPSTLERAARTQHDRAARNAVALDIVAATPTEIRMFLRKQHAPFANLAVARGQGDGGAFVPVGAALVQAGGAPASAVFYRVDGEPVTLLAARTADLEDPPERSFASLKITHRQTNGLHTYAWTQAGQSYTLATTGSARQACRLCHADAAFVERLTRGADPR
jgi:anti-sigma factor RsiW